MNLPVLLRPTLVLTALLAFGGAAAADPTPEQIEHFEKKVRPVLVQHCYKCHSTQAKRPKGGLLLDSREGLLKGGDNGPVLAPGQPDKSRLIQAVRYGDPDLQMPPKGKLPEPAIADLVSWVKMGAPWPKEPGGAGTTNRYAFDLAQRKAKHWCWRPIQAQEPPRVRDTRWPRDPVDCFLLAKLEGKGLTPAPPADRPTLLRRVTFDLIGLPPTPEEVAAFVADRSPDAFAKVVDRLLASPHFGERWGRHWLDLVRYAESRGHEFDYPQPGASEYRDYVIRAFNADVPYNQFVIEHLAGDLLAKPRRHPTAGFNESILGTGFWFLGEQLHSPVDLCQDKADRFDNMIDVMSKTFLGLTVACARCHDHKFDAISQKDYYALCGFLESSSYRLVRFETLEQNRQVAAKLGALRQRARSALQRALAEILRPGLGRLSDYLLVARQIVGAGASRQGRLTQIAHARGLDRARLERWVRHLQKAMTDKHDPFHAFVTADVGHLAESWRKQEAAAEAALNGAEIIADYRKPAVTMWIQDGFAFGPGPVQPGDVRLSGMPTAPAIQLFDYGAAQSDPIWNRLRPAPGVVLEPGAPGAMIGSGRLLRTPTFPITSGPIFYLVKGKGRAYAAVDAHVMIAGPLHGSLVQEVAGGPDFRWVQHDLSRYKGSLVHIEFTPAAGSDFAVALVVQAAKQPALVTRPNHALLQLIGEENASSGKTRAVGYQHLLREVTERLASDCLSGSANAADYASLAAWMLQHLELFAADEFAARKHLAAAAKPFFAEQAALVAQIKSESRLAPALLDGNGIDEHVFIRGLYKTPGPLAPRRLLEALAGPAPLKVQQGSGRLELARQMTDPALNPLLPRVLVNRVWQHLFGRGLVASVDNFGVLGEPPTHPELLDWLADRFVKEGWSIKKLVHELVLSRAYQMSSQPDPLVAQADPQNLLLQHARLRRLEGEAIRDALLAVSGRLDRRAFGPPIPVYLTDFQQGRGRPASGPLDGAGRRSIYLAVRRNFLSSFLLAFDMPTPFSTVGRRTVSNVPAQALILMNDPFVHQQAEVWAEKVLAQPGTARQRITGMYLAAFSRPPTEEEMTACLEFLRQQAELTQRSANDVATWAALAHVLFNTKEFIFLN
jgi:hypothetical protein